MIASRTAGAALILCAALAASTAPALATVPRTAAGNRHETRIEARHLRSLAQLPKGSTELTHRPKSLSQPAVGIGFGPSLVDAKQFWTVDLPFRRALRWARHHPPAGLHVTASGASGHAGRTILKGFAYDSPDRSPAWEQPVVAVSIARAAHGKTAWRIDGMAIWLDPKPVKDTGGGRRVHPTLKTGCPANDRHFQDVRNSGHGLDQRLLPRKQPNRALLCSYPGSLVGGSHAVQSHQRLGAPRARELALLARRLRLSHARGEIRPCPADFGSAVVMVFHYAGGRTVDLWYDDSGCPSVRNGHILTTTVSGAFDRAVRRDLR